jgi:hypothetical protein
LCTWERSEATRSSRSVAREKESAGQQRTLGRLETKGGRRTLLLLDDLIVPPLPFALALVPLMPAKRLALDRPLLAGRLSSLARQPELILEVCDPAVRVGVLGLERAESSLKRLELREGVGWQVRAEDRRGR